MAAKNMVVLFDESGTPAISNDQRTDWFLGVGVAYEQSDEEGILLWFNRSGHRDKRGKMGRGGID